MRNNCLEERHHSRKSTRKQDGRTTWLNKIKEWRQLTLERATENQTEWKRMMYCMASHCRVEPWNTGYVSSSACLMVIKEDCWASAEVCALLSTFLVFVFVYNVSYFVGGLTLLAGWQEGHLTRKKMLYQQSGKNVLWKTNRGPSQTRKNLWKTSRLNKNQQWR